MDNTKKRFIAFHKVFVHYTIHTTLLYQIIYSHILIYTSEVKACDGFRLV
jgi:hypothetical protein